jgi:hypothetical protein
LDKKINNWDEEKINRNLGNKKLNKSNFKFLIGSINGLDQAEEKISKIEDNVKELLHSDTIEKKQATIKTTLKTTGTGLRNKTYNYTVWKRASGLRLKEKC